MEGGSGKVKIRRNRVPARMRKKIVTLHITNKAKFQAIVTGKKPVSVSTDPKPVPLPGNGMEHIAAIVDPHSPTPIPKKVYTPPDVTMSDPPAEGDSEADESDVVRRLDFTSAHLGSPLGVLNLPLKRRITFPSKADKVTTSLVFNTTTTEEVPACLEMNTVMADSDRQRMPPPPLSAGSARSRRRQDDDLFDMFVNQDMRESPEKGGGFRETLVSPRPRERLGTQEPGTPATFTFPENAPIPIEIDEQHSYPSCFEVFQDRYLRTELQDVWLDQLRRPLDPDFSNDEYWADELYFPDEPGPYGDIAPEHACKEFANHRKDRSATFRGLLQLAEQKVPLQKSGTLAEETAKYLTKVIEPPNDKYLRSQGQKDFDRYYKARTAFNEVPRAVMDDRYRVPTEHGRVTAEIAKMKPGAGDTLMRTESLFEDPDYQDFCTSASFGIKAEVLNIKDPEPSTRFARCRGEVIMSSPIQTSLVGELKRTHRTMPKATRTVAPRAKTTVTQHGSPIARGIVRPAAATVPPSAVISIASTTNSPRRSMLIFMSPAELERSRAMPPPTQPHRRQVQTLRAISAGTIVDQPSSVLPMQSSPSQPGPRLVLEPRPSSPPEEGQLLLDFLFAEQKMSAGQEMTALQNLQARSSPTFHHLVPHVEYGPRENTRFGRWLRGLPPLQPAVVTSASPHVAWQQSSPYTIGGRQVSREQYLQHACMIAYQRKHTEPTGQNMATVQLSDEQMPARVATRRAASVVPDASSQHHTSTRSTSIRPSIRSGAQAYMQQREGVDRGQSVVRSRRGAPIGFAIHEGTDVQGVPDGNIDPRLLEADNISMNLD